MRDTSRGRKRRRLHSNRSRNALLWTRNETILAIQNQIREHVRHQRGRVQDDYTRTDAEFGMDTGEVFIPFQLDGSAISFESRVPTWHELDNLPHFVITSREKWDPHRNPLRIPSKHIGNVNTHLSNYETDRVLWDVSPTLNEGFLRNSMICSVNIMDWYESENRNTGTHRNIHTESKTNRITESKSNRITEPATHRITESNTNRIGALYAQHRHTVINAETLSRMWNVGLQTAQKTLRATTQLGVRTAVHPITRRYRVDHLHLHRKRLNATFYTDTLFSKVQSLRGNKCAQIFTDGKFTAVYPMSTKAKAGDALRELSSDVGIPDNLVADLAGEQSGEHTEFMHQIRRLDIRLHHTESGRKNQNHKAEREIGILKTRWKRRMLEQSVPSRLWDYGLVYEAEIMSRTCRSDDERCGLEILTGTTPDISEWLDFTFYDLVWYHVPTNDMSTTGRRLGRWLGISHRVGSDLCYWVLTESGKVISSTTIQHVLSSEASDNTTGAAITAFDHAVQQPTPRRFQLDRNLYVKSTTIYS